MAKAQEPPIYWFDTCSFTELRRSYPSNMFSPVWDFVRDLARAGRLMSIEDVWIELQQQDDEVSAWIEPLESIFVKLDEDIQKRARDILAQYPTLIDLRRSKSSADPFLIAAAAVRTGVVVSEENRSGGPPKVKIPDVAEALGVPCIKLLDVLEREGFQIIRPPGVAP